MYAIWSTNPPSLPRLPARAAAPAAATGRVLATVRTDAPTRFSSTALWLENQPARRARAGSPGPRARQGRAPRQGVGKQWQEDRALGRPQDQAAAARPTPGRREEDRLRGGHRREGGHCPSPRQGSHRRGVSWAQLRRAPRLRAMRALSRPVVDRALRAARALRARLAPMCALPDARAALRS